MPTVFEHLETALSGNEVASNVASQTGNLGAVATMLTSLGSDPPSAIGDFASALDELPLPDLDVAGDIVAKLGAIKDAVPSADSVAAGPAAALAAMGSTLSDELEGALGRVLKAVDALERLAQLDLRGLEPGGNGAGPAPAAPPPPAVPPAAPAGPPPASAGLTQIRGVLDATPASLDTGGILDLLHQATAWEDRDRLIPHFVPLLDDIADPLATLVDWQAKSPTQVRNALKQSLDDATAFVTARRDAGTAAATVALAGIADKLQTDALKTIADGLIARLGELRTAVNAGNVGGTGTAVAAANALLDQYDSLRPAFDADVLAKLPAVRSALHDLAGTLEDQMGLVVSGLTSPPGTGMLEQAAAEVESLAQVDRLAEVTAPLGTVVAWLQDIVAALDLSAVEGPLGTVADGVRSALDGFEETLTEATLAVQDAFQEVESLVDAVDTAALVGSLQTSIQGFADQLVEQLAALFAPVREALTETVGALDGAVAAFDPAAVVQALHDVLDALTGVLQGPEVGGVITQIRQGVETVNDALQNVSFEPIADEVVKDIQAVTDALTAIDPSTLPGPLQGALSSAVSVLPTDLKPVTDPIVDGFKELVEGGPVPLVQAIQGEPQRLLDEVKHFEPAGLVGDSLSAPYEALLDDLAAFHPSQLLEPVHEQLAALKERLKDQVDPAAVLEPLEQPFHDLLDGFDSLEPGELVKPLEDAITAGIDGVLDALPVQSVFDALDAVISRVQKATAIGDDALAVLQKAHEVLAAIADAHAGLDAWLEPILTKVDGAGSTPSVQTALGALGDAVGSTTAAAVAATVDAALDPPLAALASLDPHARLGSLAQAYHGVSRQKLAALPASPEKTAITALLDRFDPFQPAFGAPYEGLKDLRESATAAKEAAHDVLDDTWDQVFHGPDGALADLNDLAAADAAQGVREIVTKRFVDPVSALFSLAAPAARGLDGVVGQVKLLVQDLDAKVAQLLTGPDSLGGIKDALEQLIQRLHDVDLGVVTQSLDQIHADVRGKIAALDPANLAQAIENAFDELLGALDLDQAIPPADVAKLDADYAAVIEKLKALDPKKLVVDAVQPVFEQNVLPLLEAFDITPLLQAIVERLQALDEELGTQLDRVNDAFVAMRAAIPSEAGAGAGAGVSL
jgi:hypothetical protein